MVRCLKEWRAISRRLKDQAPGLISFLLLLSVWSVSIRHQRWGPDMIPFPEETNQPLGGEVILPDLHIIPRWEWGSHLSFLRLICVHRISLPSLPTTSWPVHHLRTSRVSNCWHKINHTSYLLRPRGWCHSTGSTMMAYDLSSHYTFHTLHKLGVTSLGVSERPLQGPAKVPSLV